MFEKVFKLSEHQTTVKTEVMDWNYDLYDDGVHSGS